MKLKFNLNLNKREKITVYAAGVLIAVFILIQLIIVPVFEKRNDLRGQLSAKRNILLEINDLHKEYLAMQQKAEISRQGFEKRAPGFTLFSFLDQLAGNTGVKNKISYMKPSSSVVEGSGLKISRVEMKIQEINLNDLTAYLYGIESSENMVVVKQLTITKSGQGPGLLSALLRVETIES
jgi:general secretion pathway protein M